MIRKVEVWKGLINLKEKLM